jgi:hypothetical protein
MNGSLTIGELVDAFVALGGAADWADVQSYIATARQHSTEPYKDKVNFDTTLWQLLYRHCPGFAKFNGNALFQRVGASRYRLLDFNPLLPQQPQSKSSEIDDLEAVVRRSREISEFSRDQRLVTRVKELYDSQCQVCGVRLLLPSGQAYAEAHHIKGLAEGGPDALSNLLCICANCHARLDLKAVELRMDRLHVIADNHGLNEEYFEHHNALWRERWNAGKETP